MILAIALQLDIKPGSQKDEQLHSQPFRLNLKHNVAHMSSNACFDR
jgi:hypothetical protein